MNYHNMSPEDHFKFMFSSTIEQTGRVRTKLQDIMPVVSYSDPIPIDVNYQVEREISIQMGENDYNNFMRSYGKYLELLYETEHDPIARDMLEKLSMYLILKR